MTSSKFWEQTLEGQMHRSTHETGEGDREKKIQLVDDNVDDDDDDDEQSNSVSRTHLVVSFDFYIADMIDYNVIAFVISNGWAGGLPMDMTESVAQSSSYFPNRRILDSWNCPFYAFSSDQGPSDRFTDSFYPWLMELFIRLRHGIFSHELSVWICGFQQKHGMGIWTNEDSHMSAVFPALIMPIYSHTHTPNFPSFHIHT